MSNNNEIIILRGTYESETSNEDKEKLSKEFTDYVNKKTPDGYHYKEMPKYQDEYNDFCGIHKWKIEFLIVFEKNKN